jgi:hypothetical protein
MGTAVPSILSKLPFDTEPGYLRDLEGKPVQFGRDRVTVNGLQIIVWVGITRNPQEPLDDNAPRIPAILDTGHSDYFTLQHFHLRKWAGMPLERFYPLGHRTINHIKVPSRKATIWLQPNLPESRALYKGKQAFPLVCEEGITIYPESGQDPDGKPYPKDYPRLPVIGMRGLTLNRLHLPIDFGRRHVFLRPPSRLAWWT